MTAKQVRFRQFLMIAVKHDEYFAAYLSLIRKHRLLLFISTMLNRQPELKYRILGYAEMDCRIN